MEVDNYLEICATEVREVLKTLFIAFWTGGLPNGFHSVRACPSVCWSVRLSLNISETAHSFFLKLCMKLGVNKRNKVTQLEF